jgi:hypothetical protein
VSVWDVATGRLVTRTEVPPHLLLTFTFSPDGNRLAWVWVKWRPREDERQTHTGPGTYVPDPCSVNLWDFTAGTPPVTVAE